MSRGSRKRPPKVSVVIPTYNRAHLVGDAIRSVLRQTYTDYEIVVVNDGSTDNTEDVVNGFQDDGIRYVRHAQNRGLSAARNTGIGEARGEFIAFLDDDDEWLPEKLEKQFTLLEGADNSTGVVYTSTWRIMKHRSLLFPQNFIAKTQGDISEDILEHHFVGPSSVLIRKSCFERVGLLDEKLFFAGDWDLVIRLAQHYRFLFAKEMLVISRQQPDSATAERFIPSQIEGVEDLFSKHHGLFSKNRTATANIHRMLGGLYCMAGEMQRGRRHMVRYLKANPTNIRTMIKIAVSLLGHNAYLRALGLKRKLLDGPACASPPCADR